MATKPMAKPAAKKAAPVRGQRTATHVATAMPAPMRMSSQQKAQEKKWQAQDDLRTLQRAGEIKSDPNRVKMAQAEAKSQMKALSSVVKK